MKKLMTLMVVLAFLFAAVTPVVAGGGQQGGAAAPSAVNLVVQVEGSWLSYYQGVAARVAERFPGTTFTWIETGAFDHLGVLDSTDVTNPDVGDVFAFPLDRLFGLVQNDALAPIPAPQMAARVGGFGNYDSGIGGSLKIGNDYLGFPMNIETLVNFVNTSNARDLGINLNQPIEFTALDPEAMLVPVFNAWFGVALTNSVGLELLGKDANGHLFSDLTENFSALSKEKQDLFRALFDYWKAHDVAGTPLWDSSSAWGYMDTQFATGGNTAIRLEGPWSANTLADVSGGNLEIISIDRVTLNGKPLSHWQSGWAVGVNARLEGETQKMDVAIAFIEEIANPKFASEFFGVPGSDPALVPSKILANVSVGDYMNANLSASNKEVIAATVESYEAATARPLFLEWGQVWSTWENGLLSWASVQPANVEAAYAEVQAAFKAMMLNF